MTNTNMFGSIRCMLRISRLCRYLVEFRELHNAKLGNSPTYEGVPRDDFASFIAEKEKKKTPQQLQDIRNEIKDCIKRDFFADKILGKTAGYVGEDLFVGLGWKGRKLVEGARAKRLIYFIEYTGKDIGYTASIVLTIFGATILHEAVIFFWDIFTDWLSNYV